MKYLEVSSFIRHRMRTNETSLSSISTQVVKKKVSHRRKYAVMKLSIFIMDCVEKRPRAFPTLLTGACPPRRGGNILR